MRAEDAAARAAEIRALVPPGASVAPQVAEIIADVRERGDAALEDYEARFGGRAKAPFRLSGGLLAPPVLEGLEIAIRNVRAVAEAGLDEDRLVTLREGQTVKLRDVPVRRAAVYAPGGRNPYPSSVIMGAVTARAAGVEEVYVVGAPHPVMVAAAELCGVDAFLAITGAQAVAALAYGTESIPRVDVIAGPGSLWVQEAKRQVSHLVGIDGFAGPSDLFVIAAEGAPPGEVALDLLAQAEHGPGTLVVAASPVRELLNELSERITDAEDTGAIARLIDVRDARQGLHLAQEFAPEHLELVGHDAEALAPEANRAGCLLVGSPSATAFGDYIAGSNHILPTGGAARFSSGLSPAHFRRRFSEVRIGADAGELARLAAPIARAEGFEQHARSMEARIRDNGQG